MHKILKQFLILVAVLGFFLVLDFVVAHFFGFTKTSLCLVVAYATHKFLDDTSKDSK